MIRKDELDKIDPTLVDKVKNGELHVLVCNDRGPKPGEKLSFELTSDKCDLCKRMIWMDVKNVDIVKERGMVKACLNCYLKEFMPKADPDDYRALIGGESMTAEQGFAAVEEMLKPTPEDKKN